MVFEPNEPIIAKCEAYIGYLNLKEVDAYMIVEDQGKRFMLVPVDQNDKPLFKED